MSRLTCRGRARVWGAWLIFAGLGGLLAAGPRTAGSAEVSPGSRVEVVVTGIPRPIQLARDGDGMLVVLGQGWRGDAAAELYRIDVRGALPVNAARAPRVVIPFATEPRKTALGSLAVDPRSGDLFLGEENGNRIYRLGSNQHLRPPISGRNRRCRLRSAGSRKKDTGVLWSFGSTSTRIGHSRAAPIFSHRSSRATERSGRTGSPCGGSSA